jgi:rubredoxin
LAAKCPNLIKKTRSKKTMTDKKLSRYESPCEKYTYNPEEGDYERNIPPGTPFEDLPDDWCCPECGAEKEFFEELDD